MKKPLILLILAIHSSFLFAQIILTIEGTVVNNTEPLTWLGVNIPRSNPTNFIYRNNSITAVNTFGYMLQAGDEGVSSWNNHLDGEIITGNRLTGNSLNPLSEANGIFTGYNINAVIKYNYINKVSVGIIRKSNGMTDASGMVAYNLVINPASVGVVVKGINGIKIYNNTFYSNKTTKETMRGLIDVYENRDISPAGSATGTKIFNNIFYTENQIFNIRVINSSCLTNFESDYNVFYCQTGTPVFNYLGVLKTFAQWQALGYDKHSVVVNPNFSNYTDFVPATRLNYGISLGSTWQTGLAINAVWGTTDPKTAIQNGIWQVGARIYSIGESPVSTSTTPVTPEPSTVPTGGSSVIAGDYYVSPTGNDNNPGTFTQPFATWQKGFSTVTAGQTLYIRGGTYYPTGTSGASVYSGVYLYNRSGASGKTINVLAYADEVPILDCRNITVTGSHYGILMRSCNYWHLKGLKITRVKQMTGGYSAGGIRLENCNNNTLEQLEAYLLEGSGLQVCYASEGNYIINCDVHDNGDPYSADKYGNADGISVSYITERNGSERVNTVRGCRVWNNSDDGFDCGYNNEGVVYIDKCWALHNGYIPGTETAGGDGDGIKVGATSGTPEGTTQRFITNCISYNNLKRGFAQNGALIKQEYYNNISYGNKAQGFHFWYNYPDILRNNISFSNGGRDLFQSYQIIDHNSWQNGLTAVSSDFVNLTATELTKARNSDGSLPNMNFLHLAAGSDLIDAGYNVGLPFYGIAQDIGAFESQFGTSSTIPVYVSSAIENATPARLEMTYNMSLANVVSATSAFTVKVNSVARTVNSVAISGTKVLLTLASAIAYSDMVTVAYTKPSAYPLQSTSGGQAASISNQTVTNKVIPSSQLSGTSTTKNATRLNDPPILMIKNETNSYSGFVGEIDASGTYDLNNDSLTYEWIVPDNISVSSIVSPKIQFLSPVVDTVRSYEFQVKVNDGRAIASRSVPINIMPYKPELSVAKITNIKASVFTVPDYPGNISDGNTATKWSVNGDNQWLLLKLAEPFNISHLEIAFLPGQKYESYFDIFASKDNLTWESILTKAVSCNFSGDIQVFDFPSTKTNTEYSYVKIVGHGNSLNNWNSFSEFKTFGLIRQFSGSGVITERKITFYPNPATDFINISIDDPSPAPKLIRIIDLYGKIVYTNQIKPDIKNIQIPVNLKTGNYIVSLESGNLVLHVQKLIITK